MAGCIVTCCRRCRRQGGFLLAELQLGLAIAAITALLTCTAVARCCTSYVYLQEQLRLQEAGRYMLSNLEKGLSYDARSISLENNKISYVALLANKKITIYSEKNGLYQRTVTGTGTGINPLFMEGVAVKKWEVRKAAPRLLYISFSLQGSKYSQTFAQLIPCYNGEVTADEE